MASTYSNIKIQLMASGENNTTWGNVTNTNLGTALEEAIVGSADVTFASGNVTLTLTDTNASQTARHMRLRCTGTTGGSTRNLVVPSIEKPYIVANDCADSIVVKTAAGTGITVPAGKTMWVYSDGTNVVNVTTHLSSLTLGTPLPISSGGTGSSTALTQGSVVFAGAAGVFSQDNANFFWDDTNNQLGIGTATPTYKIEARTDAVSGFNWISSFNNTATGSFGAGFLARSSVGSAYLYMRGDGLAYVENSTNNALGFATNATEKMRITAAGNVGIGTASPAEKLHVQVNTGASGLESGTTLTNGVDANLFNYVTGTAATDKRAFITAGAANQSLTFGTLYTERMRITASGDVGIGTTSPSVKLHVDSGGFDEVIRMAGSGSPYASWYVGGTRRGYTLAQSTSFGVFSDTGIPLLLGTNGAERMRITATGDVGLGTAPTGKLDVNGNIRTTVGSGGTLTLHETDPTRANQLVSGADASGSYLNASFATGGSGVLRFQTANTERMRIDGAGIVSVGIPLAEDSTGVYLLPTGELRVKDGTEDGTSQISIYNTSTVSDAEQFFVAMNLDGVELGNRRSGPLTLRTSNNDRMRITSGGLVGIGTTAPWERLSIPFNDGLAFGDATYSYKISRSSSGTLVTTFADSYNDSTARVDFTMRAGAVNALSMLGSGNVGIGTTAPATRFHAAGITRISDATNSTAVNIDASTAAGLTSIIAQFGGSQLALGAAATEYMRINASGNVGIGTTSPSAKLDVNGSLRANSLTLTTALAAAQGGTGQTSYTDGQLLIGNTATGGLSKATITAGSGISVTNGNGSISIAATGGGGSVTSVGMTVPAFLSVTPSSISTSGTFAVTLSGTALPVANGGTGATTLTGVVIGNGTSAFTTVTAPSGAIVGTTDTQNLTNKTLTTGNTLDAGTSVSDTGTIAAASPGFRGLPQNAKTASYTLALTDAGKDIYISGTTAAQTITIPANGSVAFPVGTILQVTNDSNQNWSIAITTDTLLWSPNNTTGTRTLAAAGQVTIRKVTSTRWWISGVGLT